MMTLMLLFLFNTLLWDWLTDLTLPEIVVNVFNTVVNGWHTFYGYTPSHPAIPWTAIVLCGYMTMSMMTIALIYMVVRAFFSWILGG